jgi:uncharacterized protein
MTAVQFIAGKGKKALSKLSLSCRVKPGASSKREGILSVNDETVELCVAAQAKEGEANKAVRELLAEVLNVAKSDVEIAKGMRSRNKTVLVNMAGSKSESEGVDEVLSLLHNAARD